MAKARVLIVGGEGRGHALGWKLAQSPEVAKVYFAPGNGGTSQVGENINIGVDDFSTLAIFARDKKIDLTVVSPEQPLAGGIADHFEAQGLAIFGPSAAAAKIEASKVHSADFMKRHKIPHPRSFTVNTIEEARVFINTHSPKDYVIKADGLAGGKGVFVPKSKAEAEESISDIMEAKVFGEAGRQIVFQKRLKGQEVSAFALSDGQNIVMLPFFQDHKQINDGDNGPNTGGMGAYSPLPFMNTDLANRIQSEIMQAAIDGMRADGTPYKGVLFAGLFITEGGDPKVIEFNCRFGDPECQTMMMLLEGDLYPLLKAAAERDLKGQDIKVKPGASATIMLASEGYPGKYATGQEIKGLDAVKDPNVSVFHSGTKAEKGKLVSAGGRVLGITAYGPTMKAALELAYKQIGPSGVHFKDMHYRKDIGHRVL